jgi:hypothetical protein
MSVDTEELLLVLVAACRCSSPVEELGNDGLRLLLLLLLDPSEALEETEAVVVAAVPDRFIVANTPDEVGGDDDGDG